MWTIIFFHHYLFSKKAGALVKIISWISFISISIGVAAFLLVLSIMNGFNQNLYNRILAAEPHLTISLNNLDQNKRNFLKDYFQKKSEKNFFFTEVQDVILRTTDGIFSGAQAKGLSSSAFDFFFRELKKTTNFSKKSIFNYNSSLDLNNFADNEIFLGSDLAISIGALEGDQLILVSPETLILPSDEIPIFDTVNVKRILTTNIAHLDNSYIFYLKNKGLNKIKDNNNLTSQMEIWLNKINSYQKIEKELENKKYQVHSWRERNSSLFYALKLEKIIMGLFLGISAIIASFSIITVISLLISQKKYDIVILRALGLNYQNISLIFRNIGFLLSFLGIVSGVLFSLVVCFILIKFPIKIVPDFYYDNYIPVKVNIYFFIITFFTGLFVSYFCSWIAVKRSLPNTFKVRDF